jgi:hypothetical protein
VSIAADVGLAQATLKAPAPSITASFFVSLFIGVFSSDIQAKCRSSPTGLLLIEYNAKRIGQIASSIRGKSMFHRVESRLAGLLDAIGSRLPSFRRSIEIQRRVVARSCRRGIAAGVACTPGWGPGVAGSTFLRKDLTGIPVVVESHRSLLSNVGLSLA